MGATPTVVTSGTINMNTAADLNYSVAGLSSSLQAGDIILLVHGFGANGTMTAPSNSGWTYHYNGGYLAIMSRVVPANWCASNNGYSSYYSVSARSSAAFMVIRGASHISVSGVTTSGTTPIEFAQVTPSQTGQNYLYVAAVGGNLNIVGTQTPPSGYTLATWISPGSTNSGGAALWYKESTSQPETPGNADLTGASITYSMSFAFWNSLASSGTVTDDAEANCARDVMLFNRSTGELLSKTTSNASTGAYELCGKSSVSSYFSVCLDDAAGTVYNDKILRVTPG